MIYEAQEYILRIHEFIHSFGVPIVIFGTIAAVVYSGYMLRSLFVIKDFREKSKVEKAILVPALTLSIFFPIDLILAGDIYPNLSAKMMVRTFAVQLSEGRMEDIVKEENKILAPDYHNEFVEQKALILKDFKNVASNPDDLDIIEYHCKYPHRKLQLPTRPIDLSEPERCRVVLRAIQFISSKGEKRLLRNIDLDIDLTMVVIPSRFLGNYLRWRVSGLSYAKSEPYKIRELAESLLKEIDSLIKDVEK